jgi:tetratricopeptide (TPR) repeat protein
MTYASRASLIAAALLVLAPSAYGQAEPPGASEGAPKLDEPHARFLRGLELYAEDDFRAALVEFQRAYALAPSYRILYNIAQVQFQLQDYAGALRSFQLYLKDGGDHIEATRRKEVEQDIETLHARVASLEISTNEPGAEIYVDDMLVGTGPLSSPIIVSAGRRKITARLEGYLPVTKLVDVAGADSVSVRLSLVKSAPTPPPAPAPSTVGPPPAPSPAVPLPPGPTIEPSGDVPWVGWVITGGLATGAAVTGVLALRASNDLQEKRETSDVGRESLDDASREVKRYAIATDILGAGALIAGGVSLYLTLDGRNDPVRDGGTAIRLNVGPRALGVCGSF